jgi:flagellar protein FlaG
MMEINHNTPSANSNLGDQKTPGFLSLVKANKVSNEPPVEVKAVEKAPDVKVETATVDKVEDLDEVIKSLNDHVQTVQRNLQFSVDKATGKQVVTVTDSITDDVIRQLPSEEALELAKRMIEKEKNGEDTNVSSLFSSIA